jgi:hypothetical protein
MEPDWTKKIASSSMCTYFYVIFVINAIAAAFAVVSVLFMFGNTPTGTSMIWQIFTVLLTLIAIAIPFLNALFMFMLCNRALLEPKTA